MGWKGKLTKSIPNGQSRVGRDAKAGQVKTQKSRVAKFGGNMCQFVRVHLGNLHARPPATRLAQGDQE